LGKKRIGGKTKSLYFFVGFGILIILAVLFTILEDSYDNQSKVSQQTKLSLSGEVLYVENANSSSISVIDTATNTVIRNIPVGSSPHDLKISQSQETLYSTDTDSGTISIINTTTNTLITSTLPPYTSPT